MFKVKEGTPEDVTKTLDHELSAKGLLNAFLVTCSADQQELFRIFQRRGVRNKPTIFTCAFTNQRHNIETKRVYSDQFQVLIDHLQVDDVNVYNRVVDTAHLERILHIGNEADAQAALSVANRVPRNVIYACVANSYYYYPAPDYRSYWYKQISTGLLKPNMAEYKERLSQELAQVTGREKIVEDKIHDANREKMTHHREIEANENKLKTIKGYIRSLNAKILVLKNEEEAERPPDISALEEDLVGANRSLEKTSRDLTEAKQSFEARRDDHKAAKEAYEAFHQKLVSTGERVEPLKAELNKIENDLKTYNAHKEYFESKKKESRKFIADLQADIAANEEKLVGLKGKAMSWSVEKIQTRKKVESLKKEILHLEESLKQQEEAQDSRELVTQKYKEYRDTYYKTEKQLKYMKATVEYLAGMLDLRNEGFKEIRKSTCQNINRNFSLMLNARKYVGSLDFDHSKNLLVIKVNPNKHDEAAGLDLTRDVRSLSGGEKSYSSVSLVLALWNAMTPPFRYLLSLCHYCVSPASLIFAGFSMSLTSSWIHSTGR